ncbi:hypothetical protein KJA15_02800 [Patescibacteria group bacterium]|nr:hypothetical protein [Patescibacteria group bacterium]
MEEEINLMEYIRVFSRRKGLILGLFLLGVIIAGVLTILQPKTYKIETTIEIGKIDKDLLEDPSQIMEKIKIGVYGDYPDIEVNNPKNTNLVKIETVSTDPEDTKKILGSINKSVLIDHTEKIDSQRDILEKTIGKLQKDIPFLISKDQEIAGLQLEIYNLQKQIGDLRSTKIIAEPIVSPLKPNLILNLIFGGALGIFLGIFSVFGKEWWEKNKYQLKE